MTKPSNYKFSEVWTPIKQFVFGEIINIIMGVIRGSIKKFPDYFNDYFRYIDLHAGPGKHETAGKGSPVIALEIARKYGIKIVADLYEIDNFTRENLETNIKKFYDNKCKIFVKDDNKKFPEFLTVNKKTFGLIYSDPTNEKGHPITLLNRHSLYRPRIDILISTAPNKSGLKAILTNKKISKELRENWRFSNRFLSKINKKYWLVREPVGAQQWTMLFGTNYNRWPPMPKFHETTSKIGREIIYELDHATTESEEIKNEINRIKEKRTILYSI